MEIQLTLNGKKRKGAADCVGGAESVAPVYQHAPTYAYDIDGMILDRQGVLTIDDCDETLPKVLRASRLAM